VAATARGGYATGGFVPGWNVYVKPHLPQYWRFSWNDIYKRKISTWCWQFRDKNTYKDTSSASRGWTLAAKTLNLAIGLHLVILQDGQLNFLALMLDLLGGLHTSQELKDQGLLLTWWNIHCKSFSCASSRHHVSGEQGEAWTLFGCCSHSKCDHPQVAFLRK
jgi:hypothetical protein